MTSCPYGKGVLPGPVGSSPSQQVLCSQSSPQDTSRWLQPSQLTVHIKTVQHLPALWWESGQGVEEYFRVDRHMDHICVVSDETVRHITLITYKTALAVMPK